MGQKERIRPALWLLTFAVLASVGLGLFSLAESTVPGGGAGDRAENYPWELEGASAAEAEQERQERRGGPADWAPGGGGARPNSIYGDDPQVHASMRSHGPVDGGVRPQFRAAHHSGFVSSVSGDLSVAVGDTCDVRVLPVRTRQFNCLVRVMCGGVILYPDESQRAGYVPCSLEGGEPIRAVDDGFTHADGDPTVELDVVARRVRISDDDPNGDHFEAEVVLLGNSTRRM